MVRAFAAPVPVLWEPPSTALTDIRTKTNQRCRRVRYGSFPAPLTVSVHPITGLKFSRTSQSTARQDRHHKNTVNAACFHLSSHISVWHFQVVLSPSSFHLRLLHQRLPSLDNSTEKGNKRRMISKRASCLSKKYGVVGTGSLHYYAPPAFLAKISLLAVQSQRQIASVHLGLKLSTPGSKIPLDLPEHPSFPAVESLSRSEN
ncbi:hypothetical protein B0H13DRAFT_1926703 [Mycena leptocephala]|nr:hypothetical protein B0H13DRAFT_1926703 [Mycena leptocephala]